MSNSDNKRMSLDSVHASSVQSTESALSVLYAVPLLLSNKQENYIQEKYSINIDTPHEDNNFMSYRSGDSQGSQFLQMFSVLELSILFLKFYKKISKKIKSHNIVHLFVFSSVSFLFQIIPLIILSKFFRKQVVVEFSDFKNYYYPEESGTIAKFFLKFADSIIVPSDRQSRTLRQKKIKAVRIKEPIQLSSVKPRVIEEVQPLILVSAYLENVFNIHCLLKAFSLVKNKYPRAELVIVGDGSQKENIESLIKSNSLSGIVLKSSDELDSMYRIADIFVHCYHIEYFAKEIVRAMSHGIPVISSPIGMVNHLIQKENILMYQYNDFSTLADHFLGLVENNSQVKQLSQNGYLFSQKMIKSDNRDSFDSYYKNL